MGALDLFLVHIFKLVREDLVKIQLTAVVGAVAIGCGLLPSADSTRLV